MPAMANTEWVIGMDNKRAESLEAFARLQIAD